MNSRTTFATVLVAVVFATGAWAASMPCVSSVPECPPNPDTATITCDGGSALYEFGPEVPFAYFLCNGRSAACQLNSGECNVIIKYTGFGREVTCNEVSTFCAVTIGNAQNTNQKCGEGGPCDTSSGSQPIPEDLLPPAPWNNPRLDVSPTNIQPPP